jgi:hypothetical protein
MPTKKLTHEIYGLIPALVAQGKTKAEIAETYGVKPGTLMVQCSRRGISLRKGGKHEPRVSLSLPTPLQLSDKTMLALRAAAKARGKNEASLACELLEMIAKDDLYAAVLDTSKEPMAA